MNKQLTAEIQKMISDTFDDILEQDKAGKLNLLDYAFFQRKLAEKVVTKVTMQNARDIQHHLQKTYGV